MAIHRFGFLALLVAVSATAPAALAFQNSKTRSTSDEVMNLQADRIQIEDKKLQATFSGRVRAEQGSLTITSDRAVAKYSASLLSGGGTPNLAQVQAAGNVVVTRPNETAKSNYAVYDIDRGVITLIGNVVLNRGANVVRGGRLAINLDSNSATLGGGASAGAGPSNGRVTGTFLVPKRKSSGSESPPETPNP
jgi:lipopolysaccharide export system protein LptA